jgi:hypothetical protein
MHSQKVSSMATTPAANRKLRDQQARRAQIISAARQIVELEGWFSVNVPRLARRKLHTANPSGFRPAVRKSA